MVVFKCRCRPIRMPVCPYCGNSEGLKVLKTWNFRNYEVTRYECPKCGGKFNRYLNRGGNGKREFYNI